MNKSEAAACGDRIRSQLEKAAAKTLALRLCLSAFSRSDRGHPNEEGAPPMVAPAAEAVQVPAAAGAGQRARSIKSDFKRLVAIVLGCSGCPFFFLSLFLQTC